MAMRHVRFLFPAALALPAFLAVGAAHAQSSNWVQLSVAGPPARSGPASAYDPVSGKVVIFGGYQIQADGSVVYLDDTWTFDGTTWTPVSGRSGPSPRTSTTMAFDAVEGRIVLFGGWDGANRLGDTWVFDGKRSRWIKQRPKRSPRAVSGAMAFQDPTTGHAYLIGGFDGQFYYNTTWRWNGRSWEIVQTATIPYARAAAICALDPVLKQVVVFGGIADVNPNNTWTWDGTDWTLQNPANQPPGRYYSGAAYDSNAGGVVFFGAGDSDTWVWDGSNWTQLFPANAPSSRLLYAMTNDDALNHPILFGGEDTTGSTQFDDTWEFVTGP